MYAIVGFCNANVTVGMPLGIKAPAAELRAQLPRRNIGQQSACIPAAAVRRLPLCQFYERLLSIVLLAEPSEIRFGRCHTAASSSPSPGR